MIRPPTLRLLLGLLLAGAPAPAAAQASSDEGAPFLMIPIGADAVAMGLAVTAMPGQESAFWNPAGLASLDGSRVVVFRGDAQVARSTATSVLLNRPGVGTIGFSYLLMDIGDQEYTDAYDNLVGTFSVRNHLAILSSAAHVLPRVDVGVNFKVVQTRTSCRGQCLDFGNSAASFALDAGVQLTPTDRLPLRLGAMVAHLGPDFQFENASQADPLPTRVRVSAAYDLLRRLDRPDLQGWLAVEVQDRPGYADGTSVFVGSELMAGRGQALFLRAGYATGFDELGGMSVGLGLRLDRFHVSLSRSLEATGMGQSAPFSVSFSLGF